MARILFVDDDYDTLKTYEKIIALFGHQALLAAYAADALQIAAAQLPDLIVVDMRLPDMDGFEFLKRLKSNPETAEIPSVMVSASPDHFANQAIAAGAKGYMTKPIDPGKLLDLLEEEPKTG